MDRRGQLEALVHHGDVQLPIRLELSFDEFDIDARLAHEGEALHLPDRAPSQQEMLEADDGLRHMAAYLVRRQADRAHNETVRGTTTLHLQFKH